jgi:hypothetical protein
MHLVVLRSSIALGCGYVLDHIWFAISHRSHLVHHHCLLQEPWVSLELSWWSHQCWWSNWCLLIVCGSHLVFVTWQWVNWTLISSLSSLVLIILFVLCNVSCREGDVKVKALHSGQKMLSHIYISKLCNFQLPPSQY